MTYRGSGLTHFDIHAKDECGHSQMSDILRNIYRFLIVIGEPFCTMNHSSRYMNEHLTYKQRELLVAI